ncbi:MAG: TetR/AcrR family transcriptional regulator [Peptococcaceae bacterium]
MSLPFLRLEPEKQKRILNAAMQEFARKGFEDASTNEIIKEANIGKGRLFHYFNTKKELFMFVCDYSAGIIKTEYYDLIDISERDIFARLRQTYFLKLKVYCKHPWLFDFVKIVLYTDSEQVRQELENSKKNLLAMGYDKLFENHDESRFRKGIDINRAKNLIFWAIGGFGNQILDDAKATGTELNQIDQEKILTEFDAYLAVLRKCFYEY